MCIYVAVAVAGGRCMGMTLACCVSNDMDDVDDVCAFFAGGR